MTAETLAEKKKRTKCSCKVLCHSAPGLEGFSNRGKEVASTLAAQQWALLFDVEYT